MKGEKRSRIFVSIILFVFLFGGLFISTPLWAFAAEEHGGASHGRQLWDLIWRIINFLILVGFLAYLLRTPFRNFLNQRQQSIKESLDKAEEIKEEAKKRMKAVEQKLEKATEEIEEITKMLAEQGAAEKKKILENAQIEAERMKQQAQFMADQEVKKAKLMLREEAVALAANMAEALLKEKITATDHKKLIDEYIEKVVNRD